MKLGFDLDGVLADIDRTHLKWIHNIDDLEQTKYIEHIYYTDRKPLINPRTYLAEGDTYYIITARHNNLKPVTERYVKKWFPDCSGLYIVGGDPELYDKDFEAWKDFILEEKIKLFKELGIEVFFDDNPGLVQKYRKRTDIPIIQYGSRLD